MVEMIKLCTGDFQLLLLFIAVVFVWWGKSHKDRQTDRQSNRQTDRQTDRQRKKKGWKVMEIWWKMEKNLKTGETGKKSKCFLTAIGLQPRLSTKSPLKIGLKPTKLMKIFSIFPIFYKSMIRKIQKNSFVALNLEKMCKLAIKTSV